MIILLLCCRTFYFLWLWTWVHSTRLKKKNTTLHVPFESIQHRKTHLRENLKFLHKLIIIRLVACEKWLIIKVPTVNTKYTENYAQLCTKNTHAFSRTHAHRQKCPLWPLNSMSTLMQQQRTKSSEMTITWHWVACLAFSQGCQQVEVLQHMQHSAAKSLLSNLSHFVQLCHQLSFPRHAVMLGQMHPRRQILQHALLTLKFFFWKEWQKQLDVSEPLGTALIFYCYNTLLTVPVIPINTFT